MLQNLKNIFFKKDLSSSSTLAQQLTHQELNGDINSISTSHLLIEIRMLKNQMRLKDDEKEKLFTKFKSLHVCLLFFVINIILSVFFLLNKGREY